MERSLRDTETTFAMQLEGGGVVEECVGMMGVGVQLTGGGVAVGVGSGLKIV